MTQSVWQLCSRVCNAFSAVFSLWMPFFLCIPVYRIKAVYMHLLSRKPTANSCKIGYTHVSYSFSLGILASVPNHSFKLCPFDIDIILYQCTTGADLWLKVELPRIKIHHELLSATGQSTRLQCLAMLYVRHTNAHASGCVIDSQGASFKL